MAEFQQNVYYGYAAGLPGEIADDGPLRSQSFRLVANTDQTPNPPIAFGVAYTYASVGDYANPNGLAGTQTATPGANATAGNFAGILINPKAHAAYGTAAGGPLAPVYSLPDGSWGELCTMGILFALVTTTAAVPAGSPICFDPTTGLLTAYTGALPAAHTLIPGARLRTNLTVAGANQLARIELTTGIA